MRLLPAARAQRTYMPLSKLEGCVTYSVLDLYSSCTTVPVVQLLDYSTQQHTILVHPWVVIGRTWYTPHTGRWDVAPSRPAVTPPASASAWSICR